LYNVRIGMILVFLSLLHTIVWYILRPSAGLVSAFSPYSVVWITAVF